MSQTRTAYTAVIETAATAWELDPHLLEALVIAESAGHADAFRFEPLYAQRYRVAERYPQWPVRAVAASYGLCQLMFLTAKGLGYVGEPEGLFLPSLNISLGAQYLRACWDWATTFGQPDPVTLQAALCSYNGGRNSNTSPMNPRPSNITYAVKVLKIASDLA